MVCRIRTEGFPVRKVDMKAGAIRVCPPHACLLCITVQTHRYVKTCRTRIVPGWRHLYDLPMHQLSLALHLVKVCDLGACFDIHRCSSSGGYGGDKALSQNNFSKLTLLLSSPTLECLVLCTRMHGTLGRGQ